MKNRITGFFLGIAVLFVLNSCDKTEGALYSGEPNKASFFFQSLNIPLEEGVLNIPIGRTSSSGEFSLPVTFTSDGAGYTDIFQLEEPVKFADGQGKTYARIKYGDISTIDPGTLSVAAVGNDINVGLAFPMSLAFDAEKASHLGINEIDILASLQLEFENIGEAILDSYAGWEEDELTVQVQKAIGANVYKLVSPFGENSIAFMIKSDGTTVVFPNQVIGVHSTYGPISMSNVTGTFENGVVTLNVGGYTVADGSFGSGIEVIHLPN